MVKNQCINATRETEHHFLIALMNGNYSRNINLIEFENKFVFNENSTNFKDGLYTFEDVNS